MIENNSENFNNETNGSLQFYSLPAEPIVKDRRNELDTKVWFEYNAKLQQKKNKARKLLVEMGVLGKKGENEYDHYKYFTEAQYKEVANKVLSQAGLEIKTNLVEMNNYSVQNSKTPVGRTAKMQYLIIDSETGFYEDTIIEGEGLDRGDKAGYKAYTGAFKYFIANTFFIPTGDDPESESPEEKEDTNQSKSKTKGKEPVKATKKQIESIKQLFSDDEITKALELVKKEKLEDLTIYEASSLISKRAKKEEDKENE